MFLITTADRDSEPLDKAPSIWYDADMAKRQSRRLTDQLRRMIDESGLTRYEIAKRTGIDESALAKFYNGQRGVSAEALDALGECLNLEIVMRRKPTKPKRK
jgi:cyanate lyase